VVSNLVALKMVIPSREFGSKTLFCRSRMAIKTGTKSIEAYKAKGLTPPTEDPIELAEKVRKIY